MALNLGIQTYQILTNDDEVCILSFSSVLLAVTLFLFCFPLNLTLKIHLLLAFFRIILISKVYGENFHKF